MINKYRRALIEWCQYSPAARLIYYLIGMYCIAFGFIFLAGVYQKQYSDCEIHTRWHYLVFPHEYVCKAGVWMNERID